MRRFLLSIPKWTLAANISPLISTTARVSIRTASIDFRPRPTVKNLHYVVRTYSQKKDLTDIVEVENNEPTDNQDATPRDPAKDRTKTIPLEVSVRYMQSSAYKQTYGDNHVWVLYRRNFKGQFAPKNTRKSCVRKGMISTGNPCPICRDEYLVLDYRNEKLLRQFISPFNGEVLSSFKTGVCQEKHAMLIAEIEKAKEHGILLFDIPFREYNYDEYKAIHASYKNE